MRRRSSTPKYVFIWCVVLLSQFVYGAVTDKGTPADFDFTQRGHAAVEKKELQNCSEAAVDQFPKSHFTIEERRSGWLIIHVIIATYMFVCLSTLCEDYFIPAIEVLTVALGINDGVAGATFMAGASSVPAIAASLIAILVAKGDLGVSTALGSAVLNTAGCVSAGALFAGKMVMLSRWPLYRDTVFCFVSMFVMVITMYDSIIMWYESTILLLFYLLYITFMIYDEKLKAMCEGKFSFLRNKPPPEGKGFPSSTNTADAPISLTTRGFDTTASEPYQRTIRVSITRGRKNFVPRSSNGVEVTTRGGSYLRTDEKSNASADASPEEVSNGLWSYFKTELEPPSNKFALIFWILYLPIIILFVFTIPNCAREKCKKLFGVTLLVSTLYITVASYLLVWMISVIGFTLNIPDAAMGLTFLAIGVTLPDVVISVISTRRGHPDMAMSNAIASNIVEILVGLALPWLVKSLFITPGEPIILESRGMIWFTIYLLLSLAFLLLLTNLCKWVLSKLYGAILMIWYLVFLLVSVLHELGYVGGERLVVCPSSY